MRFLWRRLACRLGPIWLLPALVGAALFGDSAALDAEEYSAYADPEKPVLSVILSEERNVEEFAKRFDLSDEEVEDVLAAVRKENEALAQEYGESERIVAANRGLSDEEVARKIAASGYHEEVRAAVAATKGEVEAILPEAQSTELGSWVDGQWDQEVKEASTEESTEVMRTSSGSRALRCKVFATQYHGYTRYEAALPHRKLKFGERPRVRIRRVSGSRVVRPRIKEVGPWNTYDNYWAKREHRTMWKKLRRCTPEAQAAYYNNFNNGRDEFGRKVLNPAGVDLTPRVARGMGLRKYQNAWVYVRFPWIRR